MTLYLTGSSGKATRAAAATGMPLGLLIAPHSPHYTAHIDDYPMGWAADNGCYNASTYVGDDAWIAWLEHPDHLARTRTCLFATAPDVVGDAAATLARSAPHLTRIRQMGYPAALVAQDGLESLAVPWDTFDVLFLGGSTGWKLSPAAAALAAEASRRGKPVHMGRVSSRRRLAYAAAIGCATADGTFIAFGPDKNLRRVAGWVESIDRDGTQGVLL